MLAQNDGLGNERLLRASHTPAHLLQPGGQAYGRVWQRRTCKALLYGSWLLLLVWALTNTPGAKSPGASGVMASGLRLWVTMRFPVVDAAPWPNSTPPRTGSGHVPAKTESDNDRPTQRVSEASLVDGNTPPAALARLPPGPPVRSLDGHVPPPPMASGAAGESQTLQTGVEQVDANADHKAGGREAQQGSENVAEDSQGVAGSQDAASGAQAGKPPPEVVSEATVQVVPDSKGQMSKHYYRFSNVQLTRKELRFFYPEGARAPGPGLVPGWNCWRRVTGRSACVRGLLNVECPPAKRGAAS